MAKASSEVEEVLSLLHPLERAVLPHISSCGTVSELSARSGLKDVEAMRAVQWLENKKVLIASSSTSSFITLDENGKNYLRSGLPEKRFLAALSDGKECSLEDLQRKGKLENDEVGVSLGILKRIGAITLSPEKMLSITTAGKRILQAGTAEEELLGKLGSGQLLVSSLSPSENKICDEFRRRKRIISISTKTEWSFTLTPLGKQVAGARLQARATADRLTHQMLKDKSWKSAALRKYDVTTPVPAITGGRRHITQQTAAFIRSIWLEMGFTEMTGSLVNTSFWNFDALFTAQDHPVRELQDTFYLADPAAGKLPSDRKLVHAVQEMHETGSAGSTGWGYKWDPDNALRNVLRTHTTVLSAKTLAALDKDKLPAKYFSVARCFRNEALDWKHLFEFTQVEGIVVDRNANFRNLLAYLREFFKKLGYEKIRIRPAYFPYTEPSAEVEVYHPLKKQWVELGGAGIFRPEVVIPLLGEDIPVLAWGMGFERSIAEHFKITDIRNLFAGDLKQLRELKAWTR